MSKDAELAGCKQAFNDIFRLLQQQYSGSNCGYNWNDFLMGGTVIMIKIAGEFFFLRRELIIRVVYVAA